MAIEVKPPFPVFTDSDGTPLEAGYVYIGTANLDPVNNPIATYWDGDLTITANQPIRTINGYLSRDGSPAAIFTEAAYSITVKNKNGVLVYTNSESLAEETTTSSYLDINDYAGVDGTGVTDSTTGINAAILDSKTQGKRLRGAGTFLISSKVVINCPFDGSDMTWNVTGAPAIAVEVSTGSDDDPIDIFTLTSEAGIILPSLVNLNKPSVGWAAQGIGLRYVNVQNMKITERLIKDFAIGVQHNSFSQGCGYNTVQGGYLRNNGINRQFKTGDLTGFTNRWDIFGGRYFHLSGEGTAVSGVYHVHIPTGNTFLVNDINIFGASLEGVAEEFHANIGGAYVNFIGCRWESTAGIKINFANGGVVAGEGANNTIIYGRGSTGITVTTSGAGAASALSNHIFSADGLAVGGGTSVMRNTSSSATAFLVGYAAATNEHTADPSTDYEIALAAQYLKGKRATDAFERVKLDLQNGRIYLGNASAAITNHFSAVGTTGIKCATGGFAVEDGITEPGTVTGCTWIYVDTADGDLKVKFGDGVIKTLATDV